MELASSAVGKRGSEGRGRNRGGGGHWVRLAWYDTAAGLPRVSGSRTKGIRKARMALSGSTTTKNKREPTAIALKPMEITTRSARRARRTRTVVDCVSKDEV